MNELEYNRKIQEARAALWYQGELSWKLDENQKVLKQTYKDTKEKIIVWNCSRGLGKSYTLCIVALEECLKNPKAVVKYACGNASDAQKIIQPLMRDIIEDCPDDIKPRFHVKESVYRFPNGAQIQLVGLEKNKAESLRGGSSILCIVDEAGTKSLKDLKYIITSIMLPAVTRTKAINGKIILASTPPISPDHPYVYYLRRAEIRNAAITRTVYTNPRFTEEMLNQIIEESGGVDSPDFQREYLCKILIDENYAVVPEFGKAQEKIIKEWKRPAYLDGYVAMDLGIRDLTVVLFGYYDFLNNKVIIEDEFVMNGQKATTQALAEAIREKENKVFTNDITGEFVPPYKRVSDINLQILNDLYHSHGLLFLPTRKDDADAALNNLRMMIAAEQIIIHPRCVTLIRHLREATWASNRKTYARSADNGHYDALDALKYLIRNVDLGRNPYPAGYGIQRSEDRFLVRKTQSNYQQLANTLLNRKNNK